MPQQLVSKAELARMAGISRAAVSQACGKKGKLSAACVADRVDLSHPAVAKYMAGRGPVPEPEPKLSPASRGRARPSDAMPPEPPPAPPDAEAIKAIEGYGHLTLNELVDRFGTDRKFRDWLDATKKIEDIRKARLSNDVTEGTLIARALVEMHVFGAIEAGNRKLLQDFPQTATKLLYESARGDIPIEDAEAKLRNLVSKQLKPVSADVERALRGD